MSYSSSSTEQVPSIPSVTPKQLERLSSEESMHWTDAFRVQQPRLFMFCSNRLEGEFDEPQKSKVQSEFSLMYAGLRTAVREAQPKLAIQDLPRVVRLGMQLGNSDLEFRDVIPQTEILGNPLEERLAVYQPHLMEHLINYGDLHRLTRTESELIITTTGFVYNALERQIEINALEHDLQGSAT